MPTIAQLEEWVRVKKAKYGPNAHVNQPVVAEEARREAIANKPDPQGRQRTRIALECYSPQTYSDWNAMLEGLIGRCGYNPIILVDLISLLVMEAERTGDGDYRSDGITKALNALYSLHDYPKELADAKAEKRRLKKARQADVR